MASPICADVNITVTLSNGATGSIAGRLCVPSGATTIQLLLHGFTYGQYYWDLPYQPENYSYVAAANRAGYATLNIDRLGAGNSYRPLSALVTLEEGANVAHQIIQALRGGQIGATAFEKVVLVAHSYGSLIAFITAGRYQTVNALVASGVSHRMNLINLTTRLLPAGEPATLDPKFANSGLDLGYLTTRAGARSVFHNTETTDPAVIALDEQLKQTGTAAEAVTSLPEFIFTHSRQINIPVFAVNGTADPYFCGGGLSGADCSSNAALIAAERPFYGPRATVEALAVPNAGHDVTLARSAPQTLAAIQDWVGRHVPAS